MFDLSTFRCMQIRGSKEEVAIAVWCLICFHEKQQSISIGLTVTVVVMLSDKGTFVAALKNEDIVHEW